MYSILLVIFRYTVRKDYIKTLKVFYNFKIVFIGPGQPGKYL
jgi:hypothetical protein